MRRTVISLIFLFLLGEAATLKAQYQGGSGSLTDPFQLGNLDQLQTLSLTSADWNKHFILLGDIDASSTISWNNGAGFEPIGNMGTTFSGSFNGQGHSISGLTIKRPSGQYIGLFGKIDSAVIKNLNLVNCYVEGSLAVGALLGNMGWIQDWHPLIQNVHVSNSSVKGGTSVGGLIGELYIGMVRDCSFEGTVTGTSGNIGGLLGQTHFGYGASVADCNATVTLKGGMYVGGLIGNCQVDVSNCKADLALEKNTSAHTCFGGFAGMNSGLIRQCTSTGFITISGNYNSCIGGFVGQNSGSIQDSYSDVEVSGTESHHIGGFAGQSDYVIQTSYCYGKVTGDYCVGGFCGITTEGAVTKNCYATSEVTGQDRTGGFAGENSYFAVTSNCYSAGKVNCDAWFSGGLIGINRSTARSLNCFFDSETSGKSDGTGMDHNGQNSQPVNLTTADFNDAGIFTAAGWSFGNTGPTPWKMGTAPDGIKRPVMYYHLYSVHFENSPGGTLTPDNLRNQTLGCGSNSLAVQAIPDYKYAFLEWQSPGGDSITNTNPVIIHNVCSDTTLIAVFVKADGTGDLTDSFLSIYPNPCKSYLYLKVGARLYPDSNTKLELSNLEGKVLLNWLLLEQEMPLDVKGLSPGTYILKVTTGTQTLYRKVIRE